MKLKPDLTLCWGCCQDGQFGTKIGDESSIIGPRIFEMPYDIKKIVCGGKHTILVSNDGMVYSAGKNDYGQLGREGIRGRYERIATLETIFIIDAACGANHSLLLDSYGFVYGFGDNRNGQLGVKTEIQHSVVPKRLPEGLSNIVYIACGPFTSFAISDCGKFYAFGCNSCGQCFGPKDSYISIDLDSIPGPSLYNIVKICGGMAHVVALTFNGYVYTWGANTKYQLGIGFEEQVYRNLRLVTKLTDHTVVDIACGSNHTVVLTEDRKVFAFGDGSKGQIGNITGYGEGYPYHVTSLDGLNISKIFCGLDSTIAYSESSNSFYVLGSQGIPICSGQICYENFFQPKKLEFTDSKRDTSKYYPWSISTFFDHTIVLLKAKKIIKPQPYVYPFPIISYGTDYSVIRHSDYNDFKNLHSDLAYKLEKKLSKMFFSPSCLNVSFLREDNYRWRFKRHNINFEMLDGFINKLFRFNHVYLFVEALEFYIRTHYERNDVPDNNRYNYIIIYITVKLESERYLKASIFDLIVDKLDNRKDVNNIFCIPFTFLPPSFFKNMLDCLKVDFIDCYNKSYYAQDNACSHYRTRAECYFDIFNMFYNMNRASSLVSYTDFYIKNIGDYISFFEEYMNFYENQNYALVNMPYLLDVYTKSLAIFVRRFVNTMGHTFVHNSGYSWHLESMEEALVQNDVILNFQIEVRRNHLYEDSLQIIEMAGDNVQKNLFVQFKDEPGHDQGGLKKEFFLLLFQDIFDPEKQIFNYFEDSQMFWFPEHMSSTYPHYGTIGLVFGLSLYNGVIAEFNFPIAIYQKLLDIDPDFTSLEELDPIMAKNLKVMLEYDKEDFEEIFDMNFQFHRNIFGSIKEVDLIPNGSLVRVNQNNKKDYVDKLFDYIFNKSCEKEFNIFKEQFFKCDIGFLTGFVNEYELREIMVGSSNYEFTDLQKYTLYGGIYFADHPTIKMFWEVFYEFSLEQKKKFLQFVTGTDKLPIKGFKALNFTIQPMRTEDDFLPCSHTCYNILDLPLYTDASIMRGKLTKAIENCTGFALI